MKQLLFTFILLFVSWSSFSQEEFSFTLYFEDAVGNRDSLILGYDEDGTNGVDENFGEENIILTDWNEPFEIRVTDEYRNRTAYPSSDGTYHLKKEVVKKVSDGDGFLHRITIDIMNIENWPVKISWDSSLFEEEERYGSFITPFEYGQWGDLGTIEHFLADKEELMIVNDFTNETVISFYEKSETPIYTLWFVFHDESSRIISTDNLPKHPFKVYPNPFEDIIYFQIPESVMLNDVIVSDQLGRKMHVTSIDNSIDVSNLNRGAYYLTFVYYNTKATYLILKK